MDQVRAAHEASIQELQSSHTDALETSRKSFEKQIASLTLELKATQDDLAKSKAALAAAQSQVELQIVEIQRLTQEAENAKSAASSNSEKDVQIEGLRRQLSTMADDLEATKLASEAQKESFHEMAASHQRDLEEAAKSRVEAVQALRAELEEAKNSWSAERTRLSQELEDERVAKERAKAEAQAAQTALQTPPMSPKTNGGQPSQMVPREELLKVHEAHSAKLAEVEASSAKATELLRKEVEELREECAELKGQLSSKTLELKFLDDEKTELEEEVER
jgi:conserved oligomeric Golgi complex subunit 6